MSVPEHDSFRAVNVEDLPWRPSTMASGVFVKDIAVTDGWEMQLVRFEPGLGFQLTLTSAQSSCSFSRASLFRRDGGWARDGRVSPAPARSTMTCIRTQGASLSSSTARETCHDAAPDSQRCALRIHRRSCARGLASMPIQIPADLTIVTLRSSGRELTQRWTDAYARSVLQGASDLLHARADIEFRLGTCERVVEEMPSGAQADTIDDAGYHYLAAAHGAGNGIRALLVDRVSRAELGGQARQQTRVCLITYGADLGATSRMFAHELGHLLALPHVDGARRSGPGQE